MTSEVPDPDPADWGVDEVVNFLCRGTAVWSQATNAPRPDPATLETALRDNLVTGSVLLNHVNNEALRVDLGLKPLGHRSNLLTAIDYLQQRSPKYQVSKRITDDLRRPVGEHAIPKFSRSPPPRPPASAPGLHGANVKSPLPSTSFDSPSLPTHDTTPAPACPQQAPRRIAPQKIAEISQPDQELDSLSLVPYKGAGLSHNQPSPDQGQFSDDDSQKQNIPLLQKKKVDFRFLEEYLLEKYPPGRDDENALPAYGDSGSEGQYDEDTWEEILHEHPEFASKPARLPDAQYDSVVSEFISQHEEWWRQNQLPKETRKARRRWIKSRNHDSVDLEKKSEDRQLALLERRLQTLRKTIGEVDHHSVDGLKKACGSLENTISDICRHNYTLSVLDQKECPPDVPRAPRTPGAKKPKSTSEEEETLSSESAESSSEQPVSDFIVEDSDDAEVYVSESDEPLVLSQRSLSATSLAAPRSLASSSSSSSSGDSKPTRSSLKRREPLVRPAIFDNENVESVDLTGDTPGSMDIDAGYEIATPPVNPVDSQVSTNSYLNDKMQIETPLLNQLSIVNTRSSMSPAPDLGSNLLLEPPPTARKTVAVSDSPAARKPVPVPKRGISDQPRSTDYAIELGRVARRGWHEIHDRMGILAKSVTSLPSHELAKFSRFLSGFFESSHRGLVQEALLSFIDEKWELHSDEDEKEFASRMAAFFISWVNRVSLKEKGLDPQHAENALNKIDPDSPEFAQFHRALKGLVLAHKPGQLKAIPDKKVIEISTDTSSGVTTPSDALDSQSKKRKRHVTVRQETQNAQRRAKARQDEQGKAREALLKSREFMGISNSDPTNQAVTFKDPIIYLDPHIGAQVKPHQLKGIQFMWRELIEDETGTGCLLAHTMGLGKTMQVISLLVTIATAAASENPGIRNQIPDRLRRSQTLVICPSSLIHNWRQEFMLWTSADSHLGTVRSIDITKHFGDFNKRIETIRAWGKEGGVLIISYDILRQLVQNKETKSRPKPLTDEVHEEVKGYLVNTPNIVVADEAHKMKNPGSGVAQATSTFRTKSRIAMTGSPLSNSLEEYYYAVDWIAPGYLDDPATFKHIYMEPIVTGLDIDSTRSQRRRGLMKLKVLNGILAPKVDRADVSAIAADVPPKTEFLVAVPLTPLQKEIYNTYVDAVMKDGEMPNTQLWEWIGFLQILCNHPYAFREKLLNRGIPSANSGVEQVSRDPKLPPPVLARLFRLLNSVPDLQDPYLSNRTLLLDKILDESYKAGDKVLVFTHSIPTMDFLATHMDKANRSYCRLDGRTPVAARQEATQKFNESDKHQVYLISTRAGGLGLNIFGANRVVIFDFAFTPVWEQQAIGRAYRLGQKKCVFVYRFLSSGTFEEVVWNRSRFKTQLATRVVDQKNMVRDSSSNAAVYMFSVKENQRQPFNSLFGRDPHILDKIITSSLSDAIMQISLTDYLDDENDRLTEEEHQSVAKELEMEQIRRNDPDEYKRRQHAATIVEKQRRQATLAQELQQRQEYLRTLQQDRAQAMAVLTENCGDDPSQQTVRQDAQQRLAIIAFQQKQLMEHGVMLSMQEASPMMPPAKPMQHPPSIQSFVVPSSGHNVGPPPLGPVQASGNPISPSGSPGHRTLPPLRPDASLISQKPFQVQACHESPATTVQTVSRPASQNPYQLQSGSLPLPPRPASASQIGQGAPPAVAQILNPSTPEKPPTGRHGSDASVQSAPMEMSDDEGLIH
ncbi:hypothetical protein N7474_002033 [Penicillium riverlandense]|uniref:uncharacterized protein n=1 Tax=Penicillium riverlandense TaxID=1903569 RepID=UPI0025499ACA|nr:uncharacterized protein N7474_002033 [Penicillium riverlandense]KAJ5833722.1 hypothetical protein N7474_002033 [Penicillium riverlandense]